MVRAFAVLAVLVLCPHARRAEVVDVDAEAIRAALQSMAARPVGAVTIGVKPGGHGKRVSWQQPGMLEVPLVEASGEWLVDGAALAVTSGRRVVLVWRLEDRAARRAVMARLAREVGIRGAERALRRLAAQERLVAA